MTLPNIQVRLSKNILQTTMIIVQLKPMTQKKVSPMHKSMNENC